MIVPATIPCCAAGDPATTDCMTAPYEATEKEDTSMSAVTICLEREKPHSLFGGFVMVMSRMLALLLLSSH